MSKLWTIADLKNLSTKLQELSNFFFLKSYLAPEDYGTISQSIEEFFSMQDHPLLDDPEMVTHLLSCILIYFL